MPIKHHWEFSQCPNKIREITDYAKNVKKINKPRKSEGETKEDGTESRKATN